MAENFEHRDDPIGPAMKRRDFVASVEKSALTRDERLVYERWLKFHLSRLHQEVLGETLPGELSEIVERLRATNCLQDGEAAVSAITSAFQVKRW